MFDALATQQFGGNPSGGRNHGPPVCPPAPLRAKVDPVETTKHSPRVLLVEDDATVRNSIASAIEWPGSRVQLAAAVGTASDALRLVQSGLPFDVALVDMGLPDMRGTHVVRAIAAGQQAVCLVFTVFDDPQTVMEAISAGARGYLLKSSPIETVLEGIREVGIGGGTMTPSIARLVLELLREQQHIDEADVSGVESLTPRERDVLKLLARGLTYQQVAHQLSIKLGTVQGYVKRIYEKLQVDTKAEAAAFAQRVGLI